MTASCLDQSPSLQKPIPIQCKVVKVKNVYFYDTHFNTSVSCLLNEVPQMGFSVTQTLREFMFRIEATFPAYRYVLYFTTSKNLNYLRRLQSYSIYSLVPKYASRTLLLCSTYINKPSTRSVLNPPTVIIPGTNSVNADGNKRYTHEPNG
jgi:hypothetical protein